MSKARGLKINVEQFGPDLGDIVSEHLKVEKTEYGITIEIEGFDEMAKDIAVKALEYLLDDQANTYVTPDGLEVGDEDLTDCRQTALIPWDRITLRSHDRAEARAAFERWLGEELHFDWDEAQCTISCQLNGMEKIARTLPKKKREAMMELIERAEAELPIMSERFNAPR